MTQKHIFMSYRSTEEDFALKLVRDLRKRGFPIWMDQLEGIKPGDNWVQALQDGLNAAYGLIAALSPDYTKSSYCRKELQRMSSLGRPIIPVLIADLPKEDHPLEIQSTQWVDFREWQDEAVYNDMLDKLAAAIQDQMDVQPEPSVAEEAPSERGPMLKGRKLDGEIAGSAETVETLKQGSRLKAMKAEDIQRRLQLAEERWLAATSQRLTELNEANIPVLDRQVERFEREINELEAELKALQ